MALQPNEKKCRCRVCRAVLAHQTQDSLTIKRGDLQVRLREAAPLEVVCPLPNCGAITVLRHPPRVVPRSPRSN